MYLRRICCLLIVCFFLSPAVSAAQAPVHLAPALKILAQTQQALKHNRAEEAAQHFNTFKRWWEQNRARITADSADASIDMSQEISLVSLNLLNNENRQASANLSNLEQALQDYQSGLYGGKHAKSGHQSLSAYIGQLNHVKQTMANKDWTGARTEVRQLQQDWLSVEGDVVSQSQNVYTDSEKNLVMIDAYLARPSTREKALPLTEQMIAQLKPLAASNYGLWDAAFIPIREGLEALLVIGALLSFAKKAQSRQAKIWIWSGTALALLVCMIVGATVTFLFSVAAFGNNNSLINGWSGIFASVMLLYVGYWLHRHSDIARWNHFIQSKSEQAVGRGRVITFALLAFIAVLREGMETVIFLIGMAGRMPGSQLAGGIAVGFGILVVIGFLMLKAGVLLPLRPFFLVSSLIVFYLCFKFIGSGIHSLQMAGVLPSAVSDYLPSVNSLSVFPSWYSTLPQFVFLLLIFAVYWSGRPLSILFHKIKPSAKEAHS
ncbi:MAG: FTR1 family protein [Sporolactobacillus sp.]